MAAIVVATVGATNANSFQTVAEIDTYYASRVPATTRGEWLDADAEDKAAAAIDATRQMTTLICWYGYETTLTQALPFPRIGLLKRNNREYVADNIIPQELKDAHAELSRILLLSARSSESDVAVQGLLGFKAGPIAMTFKEKQDYTPQMLPDAVINLIPSSWIERIYRRETGMRELERS